MSDPFVAEIRMFGGNFAPTGWAQCNGQLLPLSQNTALFSLLGTYYGGDGKSTFALPNLQGSSPIGQGQGAGLSERFLGEAAGSPNITLLQSEIPAHSHSLNAYADDLADINTPSPSVILGTTAGLNLYGTPSNTTLNVQDTSVFGSSTPHNNQQPYLVVNFIIAMQGVFPPRG
jgi:microcystin-dependent protein